MFPKIGGYPCKNNGLAVESGLFSLLAKKPTNWFKLSTQTTGQPENRRDPMTPTGSGEVSSLWQIEIFPAEGFENRIAAETTADAVGIGLDPNIKIDAKHGFLVQAELNSETVQTIATNLLVEPVVEDHIIDNIGAAQLNRVESNNQAVVYVLPKPGVTDPQAESAKTAMREMGFDVQAVRTYRKFIISDASEQQLQLLKSKVLANDSIEQIVVAPLELTELTAGSSYQFELSRVDLRSADDARLDQISRDGTLSLTTIEMQTIQAHYKELERDPTDIELESIAQTWSEHCSHKTLAGRIAYTDENGTRNFENMLKETVFAATQTIRAELGDADWCVSVFKDNAGIIEFDGENNLTFKVETHNRPSALEPYGGANTGIGGVIRDTLGTGMGAKPICNTDVFCFASPDTAPEDLPPGVMHPRTIMKGVVAGVRDYGNRMGIPTVNGAVFFDDRYVGNPLVFCGSVGLIPCDKSDKEPKPGDLIVSIGGATGRDGIHGATFSSAELTDTSEKTDGGAVQIGNAITEKMLQDVLLQARDENLYNAVTDCGAGGYSSAVGEMGEEIGAVVWLDKVPLKYDGLSYTEIWISEAQERMVFAVPAENIDRFHELCENESVVASVIGRFDPTGQLRLEYQDELVGEVSMEFLHDGRPPVVRTAVFQPEPDATVQFPGGSNDAQQNSETLKKILGSLNVASKHWIIRQYDHEVQGASVVKPLTGVCNDGPSDAAVLRPVLNSTRGAVVSCGMNPHFGDFDPYHMAASSIDEAIRNCVAVGADPSRIGILDNFCWGYTDRPETLGTLVRAAIACHDMAVAFGTPFISGKDSLNNEFSYDAEDGTRKTISIPSTLLISALGQVPDVQKCVTMDFKSSGNLIYQIGATKSEFGGSHFVLVTEATGGKVPSVDTEQAKRTFAAVHQAICQGLIRSCHDLSEGGLAVCVAEMAFAGGLGANVDLGPIPTDADHDALTKLFAESNSRFVCEVAPENQAKFEECMAQTEIGLLGTVNDSENLVIQSDGERVLDSDINELKAAWQSPLDWK